MSRRIGESMNRRTRSAVALVAAACLSTTTACGYEPEREQINFLNPVGTMTPVATAPATIEVAPGPSYETNLRKSTNMLICLGAFVDKVQRKVTVLPVSSYPPDSQAAFPMKVELNEKGGSHIDPAPTELDPRDFEWYDLKGKRLGNTQPACEKRPVRMAKVLLPHINQPDMALVGPCIDDDAVLDLKRPAVAEEKNVYSSQYTYDTQDQLLAIARDLQATG